MDRPRRPAVAVAGVDGCRGGWVVAVAAPDEVRIRQVSLGGIARVLGDPTLAAVAIDMPIGLPDVGPRVCDRLARRRLPGRGSTVFPAPRRAILGCRSYADARRLLAEVGGPSLPAQAWGLVPAVRTLDALLTPAAEDRVVEAHPELAFATLADRAGVTRPAPKTTPEGASERRHLLATWRPDALAALERTRVPEPDGLDALACAWVAERFAAGIAELLGDGTRDARGLLMRIAR